MAGIINDSIGGGYGMGFGYGGCGYGSGGVIEGLLFGALLNNNRYGNYGYDDRYCCDKMIDMHDHHNDHDHTIDEIHDVEREVCAAERQMGDYAMMLQKCCCDTDRDVLETKYALDKDILETKYDLGTQILNNRFETALLGKDIIREIDLQTCGINRNIDEVKFNQAIFAKEAQAQLAACCCTLEGKIRDSIDVTNKNAADTQMLIIKTDAKNDLKEAERERRALERQIDALMFDKRNRDSRDEQNVLNNFGIINDSLNKVITALGNTAS